MPCYFEVHIPVGEFHNVKKHCISYPTESLTFCKLLLFFQNKARIADRQVYSYEFICVWQQSILFHFILILLKLEHSLVTADLLNQNPTKKRHVVV